MQARATFVLRRQLLGEGRAMLDLPGRIRFVMRRRFPADTDSFKKALSAADRTALEACRTIRCDPQMLRDRAQFVSLDPALAERSGRPSRPSFQNRGVSFGTAWRQSPRVQWNAARLDRLSGGPLVGVAWTAGASSTAGQPISGSGRFIVEGRTICVVAIIFGLAALAPAPIPLPSIVQNG